MVRFPLKSAIFIVVILASVVDAQFVTPVSPRSYAMGGGAESLCDDTLSIVDNLATMGRNADYRGQFVVSFGTAKFWDYEIQGWVEPENSLFMMFQRIIFTQSRKAEDIQYAVWVNSTSPALSWVGVATDSKDNTYKISTKAMVKEAGLGFGFGFSDSFHMGIGAGFGVAITESSLWNLTIGSKTTKTEVGIYILPVGHLDLELFILPELNLSLNTVIMGLTDSEKTPEDILNSSGTYFAGSGMLQASASLAFELSPFIHFSGGYKLSKLNPPSYADADIAEFIHSCSFGVEYLIMIRGAFMQLAIRAGVFVENLLGTNNSTDDIYKQMKKGFRFGIGLKIGKMTLEFAASAIFADKKVDFSREPVFISLGFLF